MEKHKTIKSFISALVTVSILGGIVVNAATWLYPSNDSKFTYTKLDPDDYFGTIDIKYATQFANTDYKDSWYWRYGYDLQAHSGSALFTVSSGSGGNTFGMCVAEQHNDPSGDAKTSVYKVDVSGLKDTSIAKGNSVFRGASNNFVSESSSVWNKALSDSDLSKYNDKQIFLKIINMISNGDWTYYELQDGIDPGSLPSLGGDGVKLDKSKKHIRGRDLKLSSKALNRYKGDDYNCTKYLTQGTSYSAPAENKSVSGLFCAAHSMASYVMTGEKFTIFGTMYYSYNQFEDIYSHKIGGTTYSNYAAGSSGTWDSSGDDGKYSNAQWRELQLVQYFNMIAATDEINEDCVYVYVPIETPETSNHPEQWVLFGDKNYSVIRELRYTGLQVKKTDASGHKLIGAEFELYTDKELKNKIGILTDEDGNGTYSDLKILTDEKYNLISLDNPNSDNEEYERILYYRETKSPTHILIDEDKFELKQKLLDTNVYRLELDYKESKKLMTIKTYNVSDNNSLISTRKAENFDAQIMSNESSISKAVDKVNLANIDGTAFVDGATLDVTKKTDNNFDTTATQITLYEDNGGYGSYKQGEDRVLSVYKYTEKDGWGWYSDNGNYIDTTYPISLNCRYGLVEKVDNSKLLYNNIEGVYYDWKNTTDGWNKMDSNRWYYNFDTVNVENSKQLKFDVNNDVLSGSLDIAKYVDDQNYEGKMFDVYFRGKNEISEKTRINVGTISISSEGKGKLSDLPFGYYEIEECKESVQNYKLYWADGTNVSDNNTAIIHIDIGSKNQKLTAYNDVSTTFEVTKVDSWYYDANASVINNKEKVPGVEFTLYPDSNDNGVFDEVDKKSDDKIVVQDSDNDGVLKFKSLGLGRYFLVETKTVPGYYLSNKIQEVLIENGKDEYKTVLENTPYSAKVRIKKIDADDNSWYLSGASFELFEDTNKNGKYDSSDKKAQTLKDGEFKEVKVIEMKDKDSKPYYGTVIMVDDKYEDAQLHFGKYILVEKVAPDNHIIDGNSEIAFEIEKADTSVKDFKAKEIVLSVKNKQDFSTSLGTKNKTYKSVEYSKSSELVDYVSFKNLRVGETYTVQGELMAKVIEDDGTIIAKSTGIKNSVTFVVEDNENGFDAPDNTRRVSGTIEVPFVCDLTEWNEYSGFVAFEEMYHESSNGKSLVGIHKDINDSWQTIEFPEIRTAALDDSTETKSLIYSKTAKIKDTVSYTNLIEGSTYKVSGIVYSKETGEKLKDSSGNYVVGSTTISISKNNPGVTGFKEMEDGTTYVSGTVDVFFEVDTTILKGKTLVVGEELREGELLIAVHSDLSDENQTLYVPEASTIAKSSDGSKVLKTTGKATIIDTISYKNLTPGTLYRAEATVYKNDGTQLYFNGAPLLSVVEFVPENSEGTVDVKISFDSTVFKPGDVVVVFEKVYDVATAEEKENDKQYEDVLIAVHEDLNDRNQSLTFEVPATGEVTARYTIAGGLVFIIGTLGYALNKKFRYEKKNKNN